MKDDLTRAMLQGGVLIKLDSDNTILAVALATDDYGVGKDVASALDALVDSVEETYVFLTTEREYLTPRLRGQLQWLDRHVDSRNP